MSGIEIAECYCGWFWESNNYSRTKEAGEKHIAESKPSDSPIFAYSPDTRPISELTFDEFQSMNIERCRRAFPMCDDWSLNDWAVALSGEVGELCNLLKKDRRRLATDERYMLDGPFHEMARQNVLNELADIITYADLMISLLSGATSEVVLTKFSEVSARIGYQPLKPATPPENKPTNLDNEIDKMIDEHVPHWDVSETARRQLRPLLVELVERRKG